jgi:phosphatidylcholine synthase
VRDSTGPKLSLESAFRHIRPSQWGRRLTIHEVVSQPSVAHHHRGRVFAGLLLHIYTASGTVLAFLIVLAAIDGRVETALWIALAALVVDGTDGMAARYLRVSETLPWFDGARLDDIVDYLTYAFAPIVLLWTAGYLPDGAAGGVVAALPLLASCYQFCRTDAKTADHFFLGFPSYWNVIAFYVVVAEINTAWTAALLVVCSILAFVPIRYLYPSRTRFFRQLNLGLTAVWFAMYAVLLAQLPDPAWWALALSLSYLVYYAGMSLYLTMILPRRPAKVLSREAIAAELDDSRDGDSCCLASAPR